MKLSIFARIVLGVFSLLPFILFILLLLFVGEGVRATSQFWVILGYITFISIPVMVIFNIVHLVNNRHVTNKSHKWLWIFGLITGNFGINPFYWYFHIWRERKDGYKTS
jgi:fumarate reductase subunit C